jgi:hypothetical protein
MLSPPGAYLQFPQDGHLMVYDLGRGEWRRVDTGQDPTVDATWAHDTQVYLRPRPDGGEGSVYDVQLGEHSGRMRRDAPDAGLDLGELATPYGRYRTGPGGEAQSWSSDVPLSLPEGRVEAAGHHGRSARGAGLRGPVGALEGVLPGGRPGRAAARRLVGRLAPGRDRVADRRVRARRGGLRRQLRALVELSGSFALTLSEC